MEALAGATWTRVEGDSDQAMSASGGSLLSASQAMIEDCIYLILFAHLMFALVSVGLCKSKAFDAQQALPMTHFLFFGRRGIVYNVALT